jgi:glutamate:Na+ symporter, ESS family
VLELDLIQTLAFAGVALLLGEGLRRVVPVLARYNLPAPVLGGLLVAVAVLVARGQGVTLVQFDTTLQSPLMIAFFTTIGFGASLSLLKIGGPDVLRFFVLATIFAVLQNVVGMVMAIGFGLHPLFGVLAGSVTLTGGPATGLAFAPLFEEAGVIGASSVAIAVAIGGIVAGGLVGGPVGTVLIERGKVPTPRRGLRGAGGTGDVALVETEVETTVLASSDDDDAWPIAKNLVAILVAMWIGSWVSQGFAALGMTLPSYIGAMLVAAAIRNLDDVTGWFGLSHRFIDSFGIVTLTLFLVMALMTLKLWELTGLVLPLVAILAAQVVLAVLAVMPVYRMMGRNYEAVVMGGGFIGFMLGTTANAMAVMRALVERYGPAPRAFLVAPIVGAFFIDFTNALIITVFLNLLA